MKGKTGKTVVLPGVCWIEHGSGSRGTPMIWLPLWGSCLPKICHRVPDPIRVQLPRAQYRNFMSACLTLLPSGRPPTLRWMLSQRPENYERFEGAKFFYYLGNLRPQSFCEISAFFWLVLIPFKKRWRFRKIFVAFSEYMNFIFLAFYPW